MNEVRVDIPYQEKHSRLKVLLRPILALPIIVAMLLMIVPNLSVNHARAIDVMAEEQVVPRNMIVQEVSYYDITGLVMSGYDAVSGQISLDALTNDFSTTTLYAVGALLGLYLLAVPLLAFTLWGMYIINFAVMLTLLFRKKYPNWWFSWNQSVQSFVLRIYCYSLFLTDRYPSLEAEDSDIRLHLPNPLGQNLNRFLPLVKWLLVLPYLSIYLVFLLLGMVLVPITFLLILVTGKLPRWIYRFHVAVISFYMRIASYAILLVTDKYPSMIFRK